LAGLKSLQTLHVKNTQVTDTNGTVERKLYV